MPVTTPVDEPIVATDVLLLLHVPPVVVLLSVVVVPTQMLVVPVMMPNGELILRIAPILESHANKSPFLFIAKDVMEVKAA